MPSVIADGLEPRRCSRGTDPGRGVGTIDATLRPPMTQQRCN